MKMCNIIENGKKPREIWTSYEKGSKYVRVNYKNKLRTIRNICSTATRLPKPDLENMALQAIILKFVWI